MRKKKKQKKQNKTQSERETKNRERNLSIYLPFKAVGKKKFSQYMGLEKKKKKKPRLNTEFKCNIHCTESPK